MNYRKKNIGLQGSSISSSSIEYSIIQIQHSLFFWVLSNLILGRFAIITLFKKFEINIIYKVYVSGRINSTLSGYKEVNYNNYWQANTDGNNNKNWN